MIRRRSSAERPRQGKQRREQVDHDDAGRGEKRWSVGRVPQRAALRARISDRRQLFTCASPIVVVGTLTAGVQPHSGSHHAEHERGHEADRRAYPPADRPPQGCPDESEKFAHNGERSNCGSAPDAPGTSPVDGAVSVTSQYSKRSSRRIRSPFRRTRGSRKTGPSYTQV
jgi:hypothetical protein